MIQEDDGWEESADLSFVGIMRSLAWHLWCRWTDHRGLPSFVTELYKVDNPTDIISFRSCALCHRVNVADVLAVLDTFEDDIRRQILKDMGVEEPWTFDQLDEVDRLIAEGEDSEA
jgi:hypothetical protein